jgi:hypothetical protein
MRPLGDAEKCVVDALISTFNGRWRDTFCTDVSRRGQP